jgi:tetratricopeptide (TPR) repeat protein
MVHQELENVPAAKSQYEQVLAIEADNVGALSNLAWLLATSNDQQLRNPQEALRLARQAAELTGYQRYEQLGTLAAAAASAGYFDEAVKWQTRAVELAPASRTATLRARLRLYQSGQVFRIE